MAVSRPLRMLSLCSGIGGIDYAWSHVLGQEIAGQVEIDDYCNAVLVKHWPDVPRLRDIREVHGDEFGSIDLVAGGIPCQPWSVAGQQRGTRDDRHLWPAMRRIIQTIRPTWVLIENVAGFAALALDDVCTDLDHLFYEVTAFMVPAAAVEAPHLRERIFVVAHANEQRRQQEPRSASRHEAEASWRPIEERATLRHHIATGDGQGAIVADTTHGGLRRGHTSRQAGQPTRSGETVADDDSGGRDGFTLIEGQEQTRRGGTRQGGVGQADTASTRPQGEERAESSVCRDAFRRNSEDVEHSSGTGQQECDTPAKPGFAGHAARRLTAIRHDRQTQSRMGGATARLSIWLDGHRWPAGPTESQHTWEAPRVITGSSANRAHRLKALGNAVVPAQVAPILAAIIEAYWTA